MWEGFGETITDAGYSASYKIVGNWAWPSFWMLTLSCQFNRTKAATMSVNLPKLCQRVANGIQSPNPVTVTYVYNPNTENGSVSIQGNLDSSNEVTTVTSESKAPQTARVIDGACTGAIKSEHDFAYEKMVVYIFTGGTPTFYSSLASPIQTAVYLGEGTPSSATRVLNSSLGNGIHPVVDPVHETQWDMNVKFTGDLDMADSLPVIG